MLLATLVLAAFYAACAPLAFLLVMAALAWELLHWLLLSALLVPFLAGLGLFSLVRGLVPSGLLIGALAARMPDRRWPRVTAAAILPLVELLLLRHALLPRLLERAALLLMDHRALFLLDSVAPVAASVLATLAIPRGLLRRLVGQAATPVRIGHG